MGILIVFILAIIIGVALIIYGNREYEDWAVLLGVIFTVIGGVVVTIMLICASTLPADFAYEEEKYNNLKVQIDSIKHDDIVTGENLRNQVLDMNNTISKHKCYSKNMWVSMWYSEHIGNLEHLKCKNIKENSEP